MTCSFFLCAVAEHRDVATLGDHRVGRSSFGGNSCRGHGVRGYRLGGVVVVTGSSFPLPSCFCSRALDRLRSNQIERMNASCASLTNSLVQSILKSFSLSLVRDACPVFSRMPYVGFVRSWGSRRPAGCTYPHALTSLAPGASLLYMNLADCRRRRIQFLADLGWRPQLRRSFAPARNTSQQNTVPS